MNLRVLFTMVAVLAVVFLMIPVLVVVPLSVSSANTLTFPPPGLSWRWYAAFFADPRWVAASVNSMIIAGTASVGALVLGSLAAYGLVRGNFLGRRILETNFVAPLIVPPVVNAIALYIIYARVGLLGSFSGLIAAHIVIAAPYVVLLLSVAIRGFDQRIEQVAETLGASRGIILGYVLFPNLLPSLIAAWVLAFVVSFDELILTFFLFGTYDTLPKRMFVLLEQKVDPTITAVATMLIGLSCVSLLLIVRLLRNSGVLNPVER